MHSSPPLDSQAINADEKEDRKQAINPERLHYHQTPITHVPQIISLYESHRASYADATVSSAARMQSAKALAMALLSHYYPTSEGCTTKPCPLGPVAQHGMSFILAAEDESDIWNFKPSTENAKKGKRRSHLTKKQRDIITAAEYNYGLSYLSNLHWHRIEPENMAAFVVERASDTAPAAKSPLLYLAILMHESNSPPSFSTANALHRSDILTDLLCRHAHVQKGHGILFHGPLLEVYDFIRGAEWVHSARRTVNTQDSEPRMVLADGRPGWGKLVLDMRVAELEKLDAVLGQVVARDGVLGGVGVGVDAGIGHGLTAPMADAVASNDNDDDNDNDDNADATDADAEGEEDL